MIEKQINVTHEAGIHARPASALVSTTSKFASEVTIIKDNQIANGKSILNILMLAVECGSKLTIKTEGEDEQELMNAIIQLFDNHFEVKN